MHRREFVAGALAAMATQSVAAAGPAQADGPRLDRMIGQMIMVGFRGDRPGDPRVATVVEQIARSEVGGVLYLRHNLADRHAAVALNRAFAEAGQGAPPLLAIDQEGGRIARLGAAHDFSAFPSARDMAARHRPNKARRLYGQMAAGLREWGFNFNLAPVADLDINPESPAIGALERSYSADPAAVADYVAAFVLAHRAHGVLSAIKHFPGHGSSATDSHEALPDVSASWTRRELEPFGSAIDCGLADAIMVGHLHVGGLQDGDGSEPASLSKRVVTDVLRKELGHQGVVITDDLQMKAVTQHRSFERAVVEAVLAGNDILLFANFEDYDPGLPERVRAILARRAERVPAFGGLIRASYQRILRLKRRLAAVG